MLAHPDVEVVTTVNKVNRVTPKKNTPPIFTDERGVTI
jgi:hypothetical protein